MTEQTATRDHPNFSERCKQECTRDVVFLFQRRVWLDRGFPYTDDGEYGHDGNGVILGDIDNDGDWEPRGGESHLSVEELSKLETADGGPCVVETWQTEFVTLTREEGETYGRERAYNYRDGWRVYGVPSMGMMAALIKET